MVTRIADRYQDTMRFTVVGPDQFLASGHRDVRENKPPRLGLIRSVDAALTWEPVSLGGESDLHAIVVVGSSIIAMDASEGALLVSSDAGRTWSTLSNVELAVLAVEPDDTGTMVGTDFAGRMLRSDDSGRTWRPTGGPVLRTLAWDSAVGLIGADASGVVFASADAGSSWRQVGDLAGVGPVVTTADGVVYAATDVGKIFRSSDGGRSWLPAE